MGLQQLELYCDKCAAMMPHTQKTPSHIVHLLLTLFTAGIWAVVWLIVALSKADAKCGKCGRMRRPQ